MKVLSQVSSSADIVRGTLCGSEVKFAACKAEGTLLLLLWMLAPAFCCGYLVGICPEALHAVTTLPKTDQVISLR